MLKDLGLHTVKMDPLNKSVLHNFKFKEGIHLSENELGYEKMLCHSYEKMLGMY